MKITTQRTCINCNYPFIPKRNPNQQYCGQSICQNIRKGIWRKERAKIDPDYLENQNAASKRWRKNNSQYWRQYRANNSKTTVQAQELCSEFKPLDANISVKNNASLFAKDNANSDALNNALILKIPIKTGTYKLIPENEVFANSDALILKIAVISKSYNKSQIANIPPYSQQ